MKNVPLIFVAVVFGVNLFFPRFLWIQDEARYGEVTREMVTNGSYMVPTLDGEFYPDKPPLYFWTLGLQSRLSGMNAFSFRLVTIFSLLGFAAAFFVLARRLIGESRAVWAVLITLSSMLFLVAGNIIRMDVLLALLVVLSFDSFVRAVDGENPLRTYGGYGFGILAVMVKGPLGIVFPLLGAMAYAFLEQGKKGLARLKLLHGLGMCLGVAALWSGYLYLSGHRAYLENVVMTQIWGRSVKSWSHPEPVYFYALVMLPLLMPWLPFLWDGVRLAPKKVKRVAACWFVPGLILISLISGKLFIYLLPVFPAVALLIAVALPPPWEEGKWTFRPWQGFVSGGFFILLGAGCFFALFSRLPQEAGRLTIVAAVPLLLGIGMILVSLKGQGRRLLWLFLAGSSIFSWVVFGWGAAQLNDYLSTQKVGRTLAEAKRVGYKPVTVDLARGTISFYAGMIMRNISHEELSRVLDEPGLVAVVVRDKRRDRIAPEDLSRMDLLVRFPETQFTGYSVYVEKGEDGSGEGKGKG